MNYYGSQTKIVTFPVKGFHINAGPLDARNVKVPCVNLTETNRQNCTWHLPIPDFSVPDNDELVLEILRGVIYQMALGNVVHVGCRGGIGRTGLFLALLYKALVGKEERRWQTPLLWVRQHYMSHAVETYEQAEYLRSFDVTSLRWAVWWAKILARVRQMT
jgi:protein-tyrosine phosphatase